MGHSLPYHVSFANAPLWFEHESLEPGERRPCVLVVDDENGPRQALRMLLKDEFEVYLAGSVREALAILERAEVDIVVSDIRMPNETGIDLLRQVRERQYDVECILLTGYGQLDTAVKAIEYGVYAYVEKPFDHQEMLRKIRSCYARRIKERQRHQMEYLAIGANRYETFNTFISGTLHDLGTPLSVISTHVERMLEQSPKGDFLRRLSEVRTQVEHCNELVRTAMSYLRNETAKEQRLSLNRIVEFCLALSKPLIQQQGVAVQLNLQKDLPEVCAEPGLVRQAVLNLIINAVQAFEPAQTHRQLVLSTFVEDGDKVCLSVEDNGSGIPESVRSRIFEPLFTTKGEKGTGLGLAVVRYVMARHEGDVLWQPAEGGGTRFILRFPRLRENAAG